MSETAALYTALAKAQAEFLPVERSATNPHFKSKYAPLDKVLDAITPGLTNNGLCHYWRQGMTTEDGVVIVSVTAGIGHGESGQSIESSLSWGVPDDVQKLGAALTYLRRYTLEAVAGVAADSDDDGNGAASATKPAAVTPKNAAKTQAALDKGADAKAIAEAEDFERRLQAVGRNVSGLREHLLKTKAVKVAKMIDGPFLKWPDWVKEKSWGLLQKAEADAQPANNETFTDEPVGDYIDDLPPDSV